MKKILKILVFNLAIVFSGWRTIAQGETQIFLSTLDSANKEYEQKNWGKAAVLWQRLAIANPVNGHFWDYLASSYYKDKMYDKAIPAYEQLIELGYSVPANRAYDIACCYSLLKDKKQSLLWLQKALDMGYYYISHAQTDTDLRFIADEPAFKKLLFLADVSKLKRTQGWLYDLDMLQWEVKRKVIRSSLDQDLPAFYAALAKLRKDIPKLSDAQIIVRLMKMFRYIGDGHSNIFLPVAKPEFKSTLPLQFYLFGEGLYIIATDPKYKELLGSQVLQFEKKNVSEVIATLESLNGRDNKMNVLVRLPYLMRYPVLLKTLGLVSGEIQVELRIKSIKGEEKTVNIIADTSQPDIWNIQPNPKTWISFPQTLKDSLPLYLKNNDKFFWFDYSPATKVVYAQVNRILNTREESLQDFGARLSAFINKNDAEKLVIDLRGNNGGNTFSGWHFVNELLYNNKINKKGHLFVITGRRTFSAAQNTATYFEHLTNAIFVGEPTGSRPNFVGDEAPIKLPYSQIQINISAVLWQSSWGVDKRIWIPPLLYTPPTFEAFKANRDVAMEAVMMYK
jgi:tetratricopeptide (TPR) repeat protein